MHTAIARLFVFVFFLLAGFGALRSTEAQGAQVFGQMGPGFIFAKTTAVGVSASFLGRITSSGPALVGLDTGAFFTTGGTFSFVLPLVPFIAYYFPTRDLFKPWLGFGFGAILGFGSGSSSDFAIFFKPGARMTINRQFDMFLEARLGLVGANLTFAPVLGAMFQI